MQPLLRAFAALLACALPVTAQLDIPDKEEREAKSRESGVDLPRRSTGDLAPRSARERKDQGLDVGPRPAVAPATPDSGDPAAGGTTGAAMPPTATEELVAASVSGAILEELREIAAADDPRLGDAVARLMGQGEAGVRAARLAVHGDTVGLILGGAQVLLAAGTENDRDQVVRRLHRKLPVRAAAPLLELLAERDPIRATPELLIELYKHPQGTMREAAARRLSETLAPEHVPALAETLRVGGTESRRLALESLARIDDPSARNLVLARLGDDTAKVAARAAQLLSLEDGLEADLLEKAFPADEAATFVPLSRASAYARLALIEREDRKGVALVGPERVDELLSDLSSDEPLERGVAALLLAGIGFRAEGSRGYEWLDRAVPHELVRTLSGDTFHRDFSSLAEPAQRRMTLLSGQTFGADGAAWQTWWVNAFPTFRSHRAVIDVSEDDALALVVRYKEAPPTLRVVRFLGPAAPPDDPSAPVVGFTVRMTSTQASDLARRLAQEGVFGPERMPSPTVAFTAASRELEVRVGEQSKRFVVPAQIAPGADPWLDRLAVTFESLAEDNRWQRYPGALPPAEFWLAEAPWWDVPRDASARDARLKELVLADLAAIPTFERAPGIEELERLGARGALGAAEFQPLLALLADERYYGERVPRLVRLAGASVTGERGQIPPDLATKLVTTLAAQFPGEAAEDVVFVLGATDPEVTRETARHEAPLLRALAAAGLARRADPEDTALLRELLSDPSPDVEAAAVLAHAEAGLTDAGDDLLFRARMSAPRVRCAALRAIGILRLDGALDALVQGLADPSQAVQIASVEGIADLADPSAATLLTSILSRGSRSPLYAPAVRGLRALGAGAHEALLRTAQAPAGSASRDAALLLAEGVVPEAVPVLMRLLEADPSDARIANELATLTCVDARDEENPSAVWAGWWGTVRRHDALAWFRAACERDGLTPPPATAFEGEGTTAARLFLVTRMGSSENHVVERARRELNRMMGDVLDDLPTRGPLREAYLEDLRSALAEVGR